MAWVFTFLDSTVEGASFLHIFGVLDWKVDNFKDFFNMVIFLVCLVFETGLTVHLYLFWNSLYQPAWPETRGVPP